MTLVLCRGLLLEMATSMIIYIRSLLDVRPVVRKLTGLMAHTRKVVQRRFPNIPTRVAERVCNGNNVPKN